MSRGSRLLTGPLTRSIAAILAAEVSEQGLSQRELGLMVGISQGQISKYLRGERALLVDELDLFCHELGLDVGDVVHDADVARRNP